MAKNSNRVTVSAPATRVRATRVRQVESLDEAPAAESAQVETEEKVTVIIPADYRLTLDNSAEVHYKAGVDEMPVSHANHWWSKAQGVKVHTPDADAEE